MVDAFDDSDGAAEEQGGEATGAAPTPDAVGDFALPRRRGVPGACDSASATIAAAGRADEAPLAVVLVLAATAISPETNAG